MTAMQELIEWMDREATRFESQDTVALHAGVRSYQLRTCINKATELLEKEKQQGELLTSEIAEALVQQRKEFKKDNLVCVVRQESSECCLTKDKEIERLRDIPMILAGGNTAEEKLAWATKEIKLLLKTKLKCNDKIMEQAAEIERLKGLIDDLLKTGYSGLMEHEKTEFTNNYKTENNL